MVGKPQSAEMHPGPGFRLKNDFERPDQDTIAGLSRFPTPEISDLMNRLYAMCPAVKCLTDPDEHRICGRWRIDVECVGGLHNMPGFQEAVCARRCLA